MTVMMWVTGVTTALTTVTQTRQTQTTMEKETPVLWTLTEMVRETHVKAATWALKEGSVKTISLQ